MPLWYTNLVIDYITIWIQNFFGDAVSISEGFF